MANPALSYGPDNGLQKPAKGSAYMASKDRRADRRDAEDATMQLARKRDGNRCMRPTCTGRHRGLELPIDVCHEEHRGMGGDPKGTRTTTAQLLTLCRKCHQAWDSGEIDFLPITEAGFDGAFAFFKKHPETGSMVHVETITRVSSERTVR